MGEDPQQSLELHLEQVAYATLTLLVDEILTL